MIDTIRRWAPNLLIAFSATAILLLALLHIASSGALGKQLGASLKAPVSSGRALPLVDAVSSCASVPGRFVTGQLSEVLVQHPLQAGTYRVVIVTSDSYPERPSSNPAQQSSERVDVFGVITDELEDGVETATAATEGVITLQAPLDEWYVYHADAGDGWDSVIVDSICFYPIASPTTQPPTTPTTEPPTTLPPTTEAPTTTAAPTTQPETTVTERPTTEPPTTQPPPPPSTEPTLDPCDYNERGCDELPTTPPADPVAVPFDRIPYTG